MKQQQAAMKLAKAAGSKPGAERYGWWAVTTVLQQARAAAAGVSALHSPPLDTLSVSPSVFTASSPC